MSNADSSIRALGNAIGQLEGCIRRLEAVLHQAAIQANDPLRIPKTVAHFYAIPLREILNGHRVESIVRARWMAFRLMTEIEHKSTPEIARVFGKDHCTVMYGLRRTADLMENTRDHFAEDYQKLKPVCANANNHNP